MYPVRNLASLIETRCMFNKININNNYKKLAFQNHLKLVSYF